MSDDQKRRPGPVKKKPAGVSRRQVRGRWVAAESNTALLAAMIRALQPSRKAKR
jgi:hypothetical protein